MSSIRYRPEIDGLRSLAVIPVILFHLDSTWCQGGFVGVDVFFVISGYLISLIILREWEQGIFTLKSFWIRRARRILPVLSCVILATLIAGSVILLRFDWKSLGKQGLSVFALVANFAMWRQTSNYWAQSAHETPLLHTWSLSVEEQFYLFYPILLVFILSFARKHAFKILTTCALLSFALSLAATNYYPSAAFYLLPPRAWELFLGGLLALSVHNNRKDLTQLPHAPLYSGLGIVTIIASYHYISPDRGFPGVQALFPTIGAIMVIAFTNPGHFVGRILASTPARYIGKISYSLYLWHWPIIVYSHILETQSHHSISPLAIAGTTLALSVASYHLVEKPARFSKRWMLPLMLPVCASILTAGFMCCWKFHYNTAKFAPVTWNGRLYDVTPIQKPWDEVTSERMTGITSPTREQSQNHAFAERGIVKRYGPGKPEIVVFGDSHALMWSSTIDSICKQLGKTVSFFAADGTSPDIPLPPKKIATTFFSADEKLLFDCARLRSLYEDKPKIVIVVAKYAGMNDGKRLESLVGLITTAGSKCILIEQPPILPYGDKNALAYLAEMDRKSLIHDDNFSMESGEIENWQHGQAIIEDVAKRQQNTTVVRISDLYLDDSERIRLMENNHVNYIDDDHLSEYGARKGYDRIMQAITGYLN